MSDPYIGEIRIFANANGKAPQNWHICDGTLLPINNNEALYSLIATTYGGDGVTTFGLPDLRGRLNVGSGNGPGLTPRAAGQMGGSATVTLDMNSMPMHSHSLNVIDANASTPTAGTNVGFGKLVNNDAMYLSPTAPSPTKVSPNPATIGLTGQSAPHDNTMPSLTVNYIICLNGIYPQGS